MLPPVSSDLISTTQQQMYGFPSCNQGKAVDVEVNVEIATARVSASDIAHAEHFGVVSALQRHMDNPTEIQAEAALQIMEAIFASGFREKVWLFISSWGKELYQNLSDSPAKALFALRVAKMMRESERATWRSLANELLSVEDVCARCSRQHFEALALLFAEDGILKETLCWLAYAHSERDSFRAAARCFFERGDFQSGLAVMHAAPGECSYDADNFVELITYGLIHPEIQQNEQYQKAVLRYKGHGEETLVLKALCFSGKIQAAIDLAEGLVMRQDSNTVYFFLILAEYIQQPTERTAYLRRLVDAAQKLDCRPRTMTGHGALYDLVINKRISTEEAVAICRMIPKPSTCAHALWERACGILLERTNHNNEKASGALKLLLSAMRDHLISSTFSEDQGHPPFWVHVIESQIRAGFLDDVEQTGRAWTAWRAQRGRDWQGNLCNSDDVWFLSYWATFQIAAGRLEEGISSLRESYQIQQEVSKFYCVDQYGNFLSLLKTGAGDVADSKKCRFAYENRAPIKSLSKISPNPTFTLEALVQGIYHVRRTALLEQETTKQFFDRLASTHWLVDTSSESHDESMPERDGAHRPNHD